MSPSNEAADLAFKDTAGMKLANARLVRAVLPWVDVVFSACL